MFDDISVEFQSENGVLGMGPFPLRRRRCRHHQRRKTNHYNITGHRFFDSALGFGDPFPQQ
jgi:3-oxoacid CoA-transferase subunit B